MNNELIHARDSKELRKQLGLPTTKELRYFSKDEAGYRESRIVSFEVADVYEPSGTCSLLVILEDGNQVRILADYLVEMQKNTFLPVEVKDSTGNPIAGKRISAIPRNYIVADIETTGVNHNKDSIIEIGAIKYVDCVETQRFSVLVVPEERIPYRITQLTGITMDMIRAEGISIADAIARFDEFIGNDILVGHNFASFDSKFLDDACRKYLDKPLTNDYVDTMYLARQMYPGMSSYSLGSLSEEFGIDYSNAHRATFDCAITNIVYQNIAFGEETTENEDENGELVALEDDDNTGWKSKVAKALDRLIADVGLPADSLKLVANTGKDNNTVTSYSICIFEPDLIENQSGFEKNGIITRITEGKLKSAQDILTIEPKRQEEFDEIEYAEDIEVIISNTGMNYLRVSMDSPSLVEYLIASTRYALDHYTSKTAAFACCSRYEECSNAGKCVHPNLLFSKACSYRKNIEAGKIFFGENKNIN